MSDAAAAPQPTDEPVCVVTRIHLGKWRAVPGALLLVRRLHRLGRKTIPGLMEAHMRVRGGATLYIVSVWRDELSLIQFTTLDAHVNAVRWAIRQQAEIWSGVFRLAGTSSMSKPWIGTVEQWVPLALSRSEGVAVEEP